MLGIANGHRVVPTTARIVRAGFCALIVLLVAACSGLTERLRGYTEGRATDLPSALATAGTDHAARGAARFVYDDLGGLSTDALQSNAVPWKLLVAALVIRRSEAEQRPVSAALASDLFTEFGFVLPERIGNWPGTQPAVGPIRPLGLITGNLERRFPRIRFEVANLGCAACHAGVLHDSAGSPTREVWLGIPNTSLDLNRYGETVFTSLRHALADEDRLLAVIDTLFPATTDLERRTLQQFVMPRARDRLAELARTIGGALPYPNGSPGVTNGVAAMKLQLGLLPRDRKAPEYGFTSIPELGNRVLRSSLLYDGTYVAHGRERFRPMTHDDVTPEHIDGLARVAALFTVPVMGIRPKRARDAYDEVREIMSFLTEYHAPPFPGRLDTALAREGRSIYVARCAECHGDVSQGLTSVRVVRFPNRLVPQREIGTDSIRWASVSPATIRAFRGSDYRDLVDAENTGGYVATLLSGLWTSAPYLHNGSVPTLWHLMHPDERPERFLVGGHRLDFRRMGIDLVPAPDGSLRYPPEYTSWSTPALYDTRLPGQGNAGHEREFRVLSEDQKTALLEFLKLF